MTLASLNGALKWPGYTHSTGAFALGTWATLDASGEYISYIMCAREDMSVSHIGAMIGAVSGAPTADFRIETVATDGTPSGTLWGTNTNGVSGTLTNAWTLVALTAAAVIPKGSIFAVKIVYASGTSLIVQRSSGGRFFVADLPYQVTNTTGSAVKAAVTGAPLLALGSSSTVFYQLDGAAPVIAVSTNAFNNTNSAAKGLRFQVPFTCRAVGMAQCGMGSAIGNHAAVLYDDSGNELSSSSTAFDGDHQNGAGAAAINYYFDSPVILLPATWYRAAFVPASATNINVSTIQLPSSNYRTGMLGGANHHFATRASGSWTDTATDTIPLLDILIDQFDDGINAGGSVARVIGG